MNHKLNISTDTINFLNENFNYWFEDDFLNHVTIEKATRVVIAWSLIDNCSFLKPIKATKKELTIDRIIELLNQKNIYTNFSKKFASLINQYGFGCYPTTYGLGIFVLFGSNKSDINNIKEELNKMNIEYYNEYSDAGFVYRFKISQSKENINKIESFLSK